MSRLSISHQPKRLVENRPNATENRPTSTQNRPDATFLCHFATLSCHSVRDTNSGLRQIACDFLTAGNRVGEASTRSAHRTKSNDVAVADSVYEAAVADADPNDTSACELTRLQVLFFNANNFEESITGLSRQFLSNRSPRTLRDLTFVRQFPKILSLPTFLRILGL